MWLYGDLTPAHQALWRNYTALSYDLGGKKAYSLWWYFRAVEAGLAQGNDLLGAFLFGDDLPLAEALTDWEDTIQRVLDRRPAGRKPSPNQKKALEVALTQPVSFIQGPPGTGKTETILNLMECIVTQGKTVALVSSNNVAVTNVVDKVRDSNAPRPQLDDLLAPLGGQDRRKSFNGDAHPRHTRLLQRDHVLRPFGAEFRRLEVTPQSVWWQQPNEEENDSWGVSFDGVSAERFIGNTDDRFLAVTSTVHSLKKCFRDGIDYQYDYLIMDEASLTDTIVGLVAMSCARHLVLVGDLNQLSPVAEETYAEKAGEWCVGASFLQACTDRFGKKKNTVLLNKHFRCHPGIFGFCTQYIYNNQEDEASETLSIETPREALDAYYTRHFGRASDSFPCPIRVLWFEGKYDEGCEHPKLPKNPKGKRKSRSNRKQIEIFLQEEWPQLRQRMANDNSLSVSILCPYKGLLYTLRDELLQDLAQRPLQDMAVDLPGHPDNAQNNDEDNSSILTELTIHRSQGREYDIVYFFPVDDGAWEWPWAQKKNLVNVAVSRAKRELRVIVATSLMSERVQEALVGSDRVIPVHRSPENDATRDQQEKDELYVQKLLDYVWDQGKTYGTKGAWTDGDFGFHKSKVTSIFDDVPIRRKDLDQTNSAPEKCMAIALENVCKHINTIGTAWSSCPEVPVAELAQQLGVSLTTEGLRESLQNLLADGDRLKKAITDCYLNGEDMTQAKRILKLKDEDLDDPAPDKSDKAVTYLDKENGGKFDFVLYQGDIPRLIIEVDGQYHREHKPYYPPKPRDETHINSLLKDLIVGCLLKLPILQGNLCQELKKPACEDPPDDPCVMLRLPTDGSARWEVDDLRQGDADKEGALSQEDLKDTFSLEELLKLLKRPVPQVEVLQRDKDRLAQLCAGVDPATGEALPEGSVLLQPAIRDAINESKKALEKIVKHDAKLPKRRPEDGSVLRNPSPKKIESDDQLALLRGAKETFQALSQDPHPETRASLPDNDPARHKWLQMCFVRVAQALERSERLGYYSAKAPFALSRTEWEGIPASPEPCPLRVFLARVNDQRSDPTAVEYLSHSELQKLLKDADISEEGQVLRPTGQKLGVTEETFTDPGGEDRPYQLLCYPTRAQRYIIDLLKRFVKD